MNLEALLLSLSAVQVDMPNILINLKLVWGKKLDRKQPTFFEIPIQAEYICGIFDVCRTADKRI